MEGTDCVHLTFACERCDAHAFELGLCRICGKGYATRIKAEPHATAAGATPVVPRKLPFGSKILQRLAN